MFCLLPPAVDVVYERVGDVAQHEGPGSAQAVADLPEQQADEQVVHQQDAVALVGVGGLRRPLTHRQQDTLDGDLQQRSCDRVLSN